MYRFLNAPLIKFAKDEGGSGSTGTETEKPNATDDTSGGQTVENGGDDGQKDKQEGDTPSLQDLIKDPGSSSSLTTGGTRSLLINRR